MRYEYMGENCKHCKGKGKSCLHEIDMPMKDSEPIGTERPCPVEGCKGTIKRIVSVPELCIKGAAYNWKAGEAMRMKGPDGNDIRMTFIDHHHTSPEYQTNLAAMAQRAAVGGDASRTPVVNGIGGAYRDPKTGRMVVDVMSNVKDPLGQLEKAKQQGETKKEVKRVNTPYKTRTKKK